MFLRCYSYPKARQNVENRKLEHRVIVRRLFNHFPKAGVVGTVWE
jgi:hypothetical protein